MNYLEFEDLSREHEAFLAFLARDGSRAEPSGGLALLAKLLEEIHHAKEESFLFPLLLGTPMLEAGGPKCMTFFTPRVIGSTGWADSFHALKDFLKVDSFPQSTPLRKEVARVNSMLSIPLEDHLLGAAAMAELQRSQDAARYQELYPRFAALLHDHIKREEECLFVLFRRMLTPPQKESYAQAAAAYDEKHKTAALLARLEAH